MFKKFTRRLRHHFKGAPLVVFYDYKKPPYGGGNQFLLALKNEWESRGLEIAANRVGPETQAILFNSYNFSYEKLKKARRPGLRMVHRVDGPISVYRGTSDVAVDRKIWEMNQEFADATVFQSNYSLKAHLALGMTFKEAHVIPNAVNPSIFYANQGHLLGSRIRIIATSWSDNPKKGAAVYKWLDENLDFDRFEMTFLGRIGIEFRNIKHLPPVPSEQVAEALRRHDVYITASQDDACSNALIEALACGLPSIYLDSGGSGELVGQGGLPFTQADQIPDLLSQIGRDYAGFRQRMKVQGIHDVAGAYLRLMHS